MAFPRLENIARRITPEHMQTPAHTALPDADFSDSALLDVILFVDRWSSIETQIDELDLDEATRRLVGNWYYEEQQCGIDAFLAAGSTALLDIPEFFAKMASIIKTTCNNRRIYRLRMGELSPVEIGRTVVETVCKVLSK